MPMKIHGYDAWWLTGKRHALCGMDREQRQGKLSYFADWLQAKLAISEGHPGEMTFLTAN